MAWAILTVAWVASSWVFVLALCKAAARGDMSPPPQDDTSCAIVALDTYRENRIKR